MIQGGSISDSKDPNVVTVIQRDLLVLVDTGADMCALDEDIAGRLKLIPIKQTNDRGGFGGRMTNVYNLQIILPGEDVIQHFELRLNRSRDEWTLTKAN